MNNNTTTMPDLTASRSYNQPLVTCRTCGNEKKVSEFHFWKHRNSYSSECEDCFRKGRAIYRNNNEINIKQKAKQYRETGKSRSNWKKWASKNPNKLKEKSKEQYKKHQEKIKVKRSKREYPSQSKEYAKSYRKSNRDKILESNAKYTLRLVSELNPIYCKYLLKSEGFSESVINQNPELIEVKRIILKTKRLCKTSQNSEQV